MWTPLKGAVQPYAMLCRADGLKLYDDNGVHLKLGILMQPGSILNPLKTSGGQPVALGGFGVWLGVFFWPVLIDTIIHPCFKHAVSHVARVCAFGHWNPSSRTPLIMCVFLVNLTTLFVDGFSKVWMCWMESDIFEYCNINFSCHSNIALWSAMI